MVSELVLIGGNSAAFQVLLTRLDPCFGKNYAKSAKECKDCLCAVISGGRVHVLNEVCREESRQRQVQIAAAPERVPAATAPQLKKVSYTDVSRKIQEGKTWFDMFVDMLDGADPTEYGTDVRNYLYGARYHIAKVWGLPVPSVPHKKDLIEHATCD